MTQFIDLSNPKEAALIDLISMAIAADGHIGTDEILFAASRLKLLLGLTDIDDEALVSEIGDKIRKSIERLKEEGSDVFIQEAAARFETSEEREMAFALCSALVCGDGTLALSEAQFLSQLRVFLGMSEAQVLCGLVGMVSQMACECGKNGKKGDCCCDKNKA